MKITDGMMTGLLGSAPAFKPENDLAAEAMMEKKGEAKTGKQENFAWIGVL